MSVFTSTHFASACAGGTDWRDTSKSVLEKLDAVRTHGDDFNFGFLYISDRLADDAVSIFNLFKSVLKIDHWVGSIGIGVVGCDQILIDRPAISALVGRFAPGDFCVFPDQGDDDAAFSYTGVLKWLEEHSPLLGVVHCDAMSKNDPRENLIALEQDTGSFLVGGITSSRRASLQIADRVLENDLSGVLFAESVPVSTTLSQGCEKIGEQHVITRCDDNTILMLDDRPSLDVLQDDLKKHAAKMTGHTVEGFEADFSQIENSDVVPDEYKALFRGEVHAALPLSQSDQVDFLVRNITGIDVDERSIAISEHVSTGKHLFFVERSPQSVASDLSRSLVQFRKRIQNERGTFEPKGGLYISCMARGIWHHTQEATNEIELIRKIIGDVPLTGFYAGGEINNAQIYGYTGILTLFF